MKNLNLGILIVEIICGLTCVGLGIYYCFAGTAAQAAVFIVVGAVCIVTGIRTFLIILKEKKNKDKDGDK